MTGAPVKKCCRCKQDLPATTEFFYKDSSKKDGLNGMCKACTKEQNLKYYYERRQVLLEKGKQYRRTMRRKLTRRRAWKTRHEKIGRLPNTLTQEQWEETLKEFHHRCAYCGSPEEIQKDHVIPVDAGGGTVKWNVVPACVNCNASKANSNLLEWYMAQPFFSSARLAKIVNFVRDYTPKVTDIEDDIGDDIEDDEFEDAENEDS